MLRDTTTGGERQRGGGGSVMADKWDDVAALFCPAGPLRMKTSCEQVSSLAGTQPPILCNLPQE